MAKNPSLFRLKWQATTFALTSLGSCSCEFYEEMGPSDRGKLLRIKMLNICCRHQSDSFSVTFTSFRPAWRLIMTSVPPKGWHKGRSWHLQVSCRYVGRNWGGSILWVSSTGIDPQSTRMCNKMDRMGQWWMIGRAKWRERTDSLTPVRLISVPPTVAAWRNDVTSP